MAREDRVFGQAIRNRRRELDLNQREVAQRIKATPQYVGLLEAGRRHPSDEIVAGLAQVLGFDMVDLLRLANPQRKVLLVPETDSAPDSVWRQFQNNESLLRILHVSNAEMEVLSHVALLGDFQAPRDIIFVLKTVRYAVGYDVLPVRHR